MTVIIIIIMYTYKNKIIVIVLDRNNSNGNTFVGIPYGELVFGYLSNKNKIHSYY